MRRASKPVHVARSETRQAVLLDILTKCAKRNIAMPSNDVLQARMGYSGGRASDFLYKLAARGLIEVERKHTQRRVKIVSLGLWTAWEYQETQTKPVTQRSTSSYRSPAQREHIESVKTVIRTLPPVTNQDEAARLIRDAIAAGRVTRCPPRCAAPVNNGRGL